MILHAECTYKFSYPYTKTQKTLNSYYETKSRKKNECENEIASEEDSK